MKHTLLLLTLWVLTATAVVAQHQIPRSVFGNGATTTSGGNFKIVGTVGQPAIGPMSTNDHTSLAGFWYTTFERATSIEQIEDEGLPRGFRLDQNYPNPFNPMTTLAFAIPHRAHVTLKVFDLLGRAVSTLVDKALGPGAYKVVFDAEDLPSGVYFYRIEAEAFVQTKKLILLK